MFLREQFSEEGKDDAGVFMDDLTRAVLTWSAMQGARQTVAHAARTFNTTAEIIREAVSKTQWMYLAGPDDDPALQLIELEGD